MNLFRITLPICAGVALLGIFDPDVLSNLAETITSNAFRAIDWFFMAATTGMLVLALWLGMSRYGRVKLGGPDEKPEFSTTSWLAMLFAAGMGTGILFWGVAEPMMHFIGAPGGDIGASAAARRAMVITGFHWGLHAWAVYAMSALVLAYFAFRHKSPYLPGSPIRHAFRGWWTGPLANAADLIAVLAVTFGVAGSIAMGVVQIQSGLGTITGLATDPMWVAVVILIALVCAYMASASTSLDKGIKILSNVNIGLAIVLMVFVLAFGPTAYLLKTFFTSLGDYIGGVVGLSLKLSPSGEEQEWLEGWTLTYFIWWIAWAPFVGVFIARISRGRTIREFVFGVLLVPTVFTLLWFAVFGGTGLYEEMHGAGGIADIVREDVTLALFTLFERLPLSNVLAGLTLLLIFVFLVTSVDSATYVLGMMTTGGSMDPPRSRKLAWGISLGLLGGALMLSGNLAAVRAIAILGAIPFTFILLIQIAALMRTLVRDHSGSEE